MPVKRAETSGFCMGVALALRKLDEAVAMRPAGEVAMLGPIIHNPQVLADYAAKGVRCLESPMQAQPGLCVLIRAHGIPQQDEEVLRRCGATLVDATCPKVKAAQLAIAKATAKGQTLLLYGEADHPEVRGLISYAHGECRLFANLEEGLAAARQAAAGLVLAAQTTQDRQVFDELRRRLAFVTPPAAVLDTICDATRKRQQEALRLAGQVQAMVVVGGRQSGNTRRLAEITAPLAPTLLVEDATELKREFFSNKSSIGLTAGASTPKSLIDAVEATLTLWEG